MRLLKLLTLSLLFSSSAWANNWYDRGNAGFALFCSDRAPQVLDLYEAQQRDGYTIAFSNQFGVIEKVYDLISRFDKLDPKRANVYRAWAQEFFAESTALSPSTEIVQTPDLGYVSLPQACRLEQVIFQRNPSVLNKYRYIINTSLWNKLDADQLAALVLHEIVYREFMNSRTNEMTSERIRMFNGLVHANKFVSLTVPEYVSILQELHFTTYSYNGVLLSLGSANTVGAWTTNSIQFHADSILEKAVLAGEQAFELNGVKFVCFQSNMDLGEATFQSSGKLKSLRVATDFAAQTECALPFMEYSSDKGRFTVSGTEWTFHDNGAPLVVKGSLRLTEQLQINYAGVTYSSFWNPFMQKSVESFFEFDTDLNLRALGLGGAACRNPLNNSVQFNPKPYGTDTIVSLTAAGQLEIEPPACF